MKSLYVFYLAGEFLEPVILAAKFCNSEEEASQTARYLLESMYPDELEEVGIRYEELKTYFPNDKLFGHPYDKTSFS